MKTHLKIVPFEKNTPGVKTQVLDMVEQLHLVHVHIVDNVDIVDIGDTLNLEIRRDMMRIGLDKFLLMHYSCQI
jgi:hypothetical protein